MEMTTLKHPLNARFALKRLFSPGRPNVRFAPKTEIEKCIFGSDHGG